MTNIFTDNNSSQPISMSGTTSLSTPNYSPTLDIFLNITNSISQKQATEIIQENQVWKNLNNQFSKLNLDNNVNDHFNNKDNFFDIVDSPTITSNYGTRLLILNEIKSKKPNITSNQLKELSVTVGSETKYRDEHGGIDIVSNNDDKIVYNICKCEVYTYGSRDSRGNMIIIRHYVGTIDGKDTYSGLIFLYYHLEQQQQGSVTFSNTIQQIAIDNNPKFENRIALANYSNSGLKDGASHLHLEAYYIESTIDESSDQFKNEILNKLKYKSNRFDPSLISRIGNYDKNNKKQTTETNNSGFNLQKIKMKNNNVEITTNDYLRNIFLNSINVFSSAESNYIFNPADFNSKKSKYIIRDENDILKYSKNYLNNYFYKLDEQLNVSSSKNIEIDYSKIFNSNEILNDSIIKFNSNQNYDGVLFQVFIPLVPNIRANDSKDIKEIFNKLDKLSGNDIKEFKKSNDECTYLCLSIKKLPNLLNVKYMPDTNQYQIYNGYKDGFSIDDINNSNNEFFITDILKFKGENINLNNTLDNSKYKFINQNILFIDEQGRIQFKEKDDYEGIFSGIFGTNEVINGKIETFMIKDDNGIHVAFNYAKKDSYIVDKGLIKRNENMYIYSTCPSIIDPNPFLYLNQDNSIKKDDLNNFLSESNFIKKRLSNIEEININNTSNNSLNPDNQEAKSAFNYFKSVNPVIKYFENNFLRFPFVKSNFFKHDIVLNPAQLYNENIFMSKDTLYENDDFYYTKMYINFLERLLENQLKIENNPFFVRFKGNFTTLNQKSIKAYKDVIVDSNNPFQNGLLESNKDKVYDDKDPRNYIFCDKYLFIDYKKLYMHIISNIMTIEMYNIQD